MKKFDRVLVLALTLALWALAIGQVTRASAQERFQVTRGFKEAVERIVDDYYVGSCSADSFCPKSTGIRPANCSKPSETSAFGSRMARLI